tara:strand:- start:13808 stop:14320 length:513 start_codon:yes stop_codon:yes gene_type:complete
MSAICSTTQLHETNDKWDLYYHLPTNKDWSLSSYCAIAKEIDSIEKVIKINEQMTDSIIKNCMLFVMKENITPMWEDPKNREGGCFSYKISNRYVGDVWKTLFYLLLGNNICINPKYNKFVNGITISPKKNFCILKIWLNNSICQDPNIIQEVPNLSTQGCLFKKHEPEF